MSFLDKLKPNTKQRVGKIGDCLKCGYPDCEFITPSYNQCDRCDGKIRKTYEAPVDLWDDEVATNPGVGPALKYRDYVCILCRQRYYEDPAEVARGFRCLRCRGALIMVQRP